MSPWYTNGTRRFGFRSRVTRYKRENEPVIDYQESGQTTVDKISECHSACNIDPLSQGIGVQN
jgi:hypothetical protein